MRSALAVTALAITAIAGSLTFGANLSRLVHTPRLYGQSWDITADAQFSVLPTDTIIARLRNDPTVDTWTFGEHANVTVGGLGVPGVALPPSQQPLLAPTVIEGRAAQHPSEIALGTKTLDRVHRHVGQSILVAIEDLGGQAAPRSKIRMRIVGRSVFPFFGRGSFTPSGLGVGAQIQRPATRGATPGSNFVLVKVRPGPKHDIQVAALARDLSRDKYCGLFNQCAVSTAIRPTDILNYARIQGTPIALAAALGFLAVGVIGAFLATSIRRRRRDFAILKTLGFSRGQVAATVAWQATALILLALVIGVPAGVALGRWVWTLFATNLGAAADPLTPLLAMTVAIPVALVIANALAAIAGMRARRLRPAEVFRSE